MGTIIGSKVRDDGKIVFEVVVENLEALQLKGNVDNIYLISDNNRDEEITVSQRGKNEATMYFLIPKNHRTGLDSHKNARFNLTKIPGKKLYTYVIDDE